MQGGGGGRIRRCACVVNRARGGGVSVGGCSGQKAPCLCGSEVK